MKFDREVLSDIWDNPVEIAQEVLRQAQIGFRSTPLREIATELGIYDISEQTLSAIEGALIVPVGKFEGAILLNKNQDERRKHFTLAHELGHYLHPYHHPQAGGVFECDSKDMVINQFSKLDALKKIEYEANQFAAELLLPSIFVKEFQNDATNLTLERIIAFSDVFNVSRAATFRRIIQDQNVPLMAIYSFNGKIKYFNNPKKFPFLKLWTKAPLPSNSISNTYNGGDNSVSSISVGCQSLWLKRPSNVTLLEQVFVQEGGYRITLLSLG